MFKPLADRRVLDLTSSLAGPYCTQILAALGADVVKVEHPERGDEARAWGPPFFEGGSVMFFAANAGKRSLALDVKAGAGREVLLRLSEHADVFIQSLRPGTAERLGLGPEDLRGRNEQLVYCSIGAFGRSGPLADRPGYDPLMQAAGGIISVTGEPDRPGVRVGTSLVDQATGMWAALAILASLYDERGRTIDLSLYETALALVPYQLADVLAGGRPPARHGTAFPLIAPYQVFATSDGELMIAAANDRLFEAFCIAVGLPELADDARFSTNPLRVENRDALTPVVADRIRTKTSDDWLERLRVAGVPAAPVQDVAQVADSEQTAALEIFQHLAGRQSVSPPFSLDGERVRYSSPPPLLGEHSVEVLAEAGYSEAEISELLSTGIVATPSARQPQSRPESPPAG
jgi:crotonobetainyl-CoA:carnitine CoA-transferase CaiB-like acyl-CoA transferase